MFKLYIFLPRYIYVPFRNTNYQRLFGDFKLGELADGKVRERKKVKEKERMKLYRIPPLTSIIDVSKTLYLEIYDRQTNSLFVSIYEEGGMKKKERWREEYVIDIV